MGSGLGWYLDKICQLIVGGCWEATKAATARRRAPPAKARTVAWPIWVALGPMWVKYKLKGPLGTLRVPAPVGILIRPWPAGHRAGLPRRERTNGVSGSGTSRQITQNHAKSRPMACLIRTPAQITQNHAISRGTACTLWQYTLQLLISSSGWDGLRRRFASLQQLGNKFLAFPS